MTEGYEHRPASQHERRRAPLLGRGALVAVLFWGLAVLVVTAGIAGETVLWPLVPLFGAAVPVLLVVLQYRSGREAVRGRAARDALASDDRAEREVLEVLDGTGELTPTGVATRTSLTVFRASEVLARLAGRGHLEVVARDGFLAYSLPGGVRHALGAGATESAAPAQRDREGFERASEPVDQLEEPLSEREREVLALLASGKTNREIARELYVAEGTVKAHVASIYRKLDVHNRAEMLNKARAVGLLDPSP